MKKIILPFILCFPLLLQAQAKFRVSNAKDLISAIASNREIELTEGDYNLSDIEAPYNPNIEWNDAYDGKEPILKNLQNVKFVTKSGARILIRPRYAWVMMFKDCKNISFSGLTFGHTEGGYCSGGVLGFSGCQNITISSCKLFGSGTVGISFEKSQNLNVTSSEIFECTYGLAYIIEATNVSFQKCTFRNTGEFDLVDISKSNNVTFKSCVFKDNYSSKEFWNTSDMHLFNIDNTWYDPNENGTKLSTQITVQSCSFLNNNVKSFCNNKAWLTMKGNKFKENTFTDN
jgi:hypothetical protein